MSQLASYDISSFTWLPPWVHTKHNWQQAFSPALWQPQ
jgi:hypothetical protein